MVMKIIIDLKHERNKDSLCLQVEGFAGPVKITALGYIFPSDIIRPY